MNHDKERILPVGIALALVLVAIPVIADEPDTAWTGQTDSDWFEAGNWTGGVPGSGDLVHIDTDIPNPTEIEDGETEEIGDLFVGVENQAGLSILDGGVLNTTTTRSGQEAQSSVNIFVAGGAEWSNDEHIILGTDGSSSLTVEDGGKISSTWVRMATFEDSTSSVTLSGEDTEWLAGNFNVGNSGEGTLVIEDGARLRNNIARVGSNESEAHSTATIRGPGSHWDKWSVLIVGESGTGTVEILDGATVDSGVFGSIGQEPEGEGHVVISGAGSKWEISGTSPVLTVGDEGYGTLLIEDGGELVHGDAATIGLESDAEGSVTVSGAESNWTAGAELIVGDEGYGTLLIEGGGTMTHQAFVNVGGESAGEGTVTVTGAGSTWNAGGTMNIGRFGTGSVIVEDGGEVYSGAARVPIGAGGSDGTLIVRDPGSRLELEVESSNNHLTLAWTGTSEMLIENGGRVVNEEGRIAFGLNTTATATVDGPDSEWVNETSLTLRRGDAVLNIQNGATVSVAGGSGTVDVGEVSEAESVIHIGNGQLPGLIEAATIFGGDGEAELVFDHTSGSHYFTQDGTAGGEEIELAGSLALLHAGPGTTILPGAHSHAGPSLVTGGTLRVTGDMSSAVTVENGGNLSGAGSTGAVEINDGGMLSPDPVAGSLEIDSGLTLHADSTTTFGLAEPGSTENSRVDVDGDLVLDGTLDIQMIEGFSKGTYTLMTYTGDLQDEGLTLGQIHGSAFVDTDTQGEVRLVVEEVQLQIFHDRFEG